MTYSYNPKFRLGQKVFHATPDGDAGIIVGISHCIPGGAIVYEVVFGRRAEDNIWCKEIELSESKVF